jgi:hypothetical protein
MLSFRIRPKHVLVTCALLTTGLAGSASAQSQQELKLRCAQLVNFFDYYGVSRGENSDGARNWTRIRAGMECEHGDYDDGIDAMEALLRRKAFDVPRSELASTPDGRVTPLVAAAPPARNSAGQPDQSSTN